MQVRSSAMAWSTRILAYSISSPHLPVMLVVPTHCGGEGGTGGGEELDYRGEGTGEVLD
jgi:hypothetical protein